MIGVAARPDEWDIVREFFELFKTPWEPVVAGRPYRVVLSTVGQPAGVEADLLIAYGAVQSVLDRAAGVAVAAGSGDGRVEWSGTSIPVYRGAATFTGAGPSTLNSGCGGLDYRTRIEGQTCWRVGYNLFDEVRHLLTEGQPSANALTPALDLHIALLRSLLTRSGVSFLEVAPHPAGYDFIACLTHDIDFYGIRRHVFDRTLAGFASRASLGSLADLIRRRRTVSEVLYNWAALLSLPLVFLRVLPDFWHPIEDYERADSARPSTFFVIPFRARSGVAPNGGADGMRAVKYQASDVAGPLARAAARGRELAVHGIDAWQDEKAGREEMNQVVPLAGRNTVGVRMHWLYFGSDSSARIEAAGFDYDSTCGYNEAVGYRAGTSQPFRLRGSERLLELPITIMDTALFYPNRLGLTRDDALDRCRRIIAHATSAGGTVVVNWHDRSLAPERLWGRAYDELLNELDHAGPWFATAADAVEWFRWRRTVTFACEPDGSVSVKAGTLRPGLPAALVAVQRPAPGVEERCALDGGEALKVNL